MKIVGSGRQASAARLPRPVCYTVVAVLASLAWGSLAFGAVYPWAYWPLLVLCVAAGLLGLLCQHQSTAMSKPLGLGLLIVIGAILLQLIPLPAGVVQVVSPASEHIARERQRADLNDAAPSAYPLSVSPDKTIRGLMFASAFGLLLVGASRSLAAREVRILVRGVVVIGVVLALVGIAQKATTTDKVYGLWQPYYATTLFGPFVNRNHFAGWMVMAIPLAVCYCVGHIGTSLSRVAPGLRNRILWLSSPDANELVLMSGGVLLMALSLVMTLSRSGITCLALAMAIVGSVVSRKRAGYYRALIVICLLSTGAAVVAWAGTDAVVDRFAATDRGFVMREQIWNDAMRVFRAFPLVGSGLNTYRTASAFYAPHPVYTAAEAHSDYLQLAAEGGVLVLGAGLIFLTLFAREVRRRLRECTTGSTDYWIRVGAVAGLLSVGLQELVEFSLQMPGNAALFVVLCAVAVHPPSGK